MFVTENCYGNDENDIFEESKGIIKTQKAMINKHGQQYDITTYIRDIKVED